MERNDADAALLLETIQAFWWHVENDLEPGDPLPVEAPDIEDMSVLDMSMHNRFVAVVGVLSDNHDRVQAYRAAEAELKAMMPAKARVAFVPPSDPSARGIVLSRSRDGKLSLRIGDLPRKYRNRSETWMPEPCLRTGLRPSERLSLGEPQHATLSKAGRRAGNRNHARPAAKCPCATIWNSGTR